MFIAYDKGPPTESNPAQNILYLPKICVANISQSPVDGSGALVTGNCASPSKLLKDLQKTVNIYVIPPKQAIQSKLKCSFCQRKRKMI
jgi:hypothetical protein